MHLYTPFMLFATITLYGGKACECVQISYALHCMWLNDGAAVVVSCATYV
jgi:hypothetical protein